MTVEEIATATAEELEEQFLGGLDHAANTADELLAILLRLRQSGEAEKADEWADLLQDALNPLEDKRAALQLWESRIAWNADNPGFRASAHMIAQAIFKNDIAGSKFVRDAGFDGDLPLSECVGRLQLLRALQPGVLCVNKTWGAGVVERVDDFYEKFVIDFDRKKGHELSFAYAAESLELLSEDHILYWRHRMADELTDLIATEPGEVIRMACRSWGDMPVPILQEKLTEGIIAPEGWKRFWDAARKALKQDPMVEIPTRRNDPIRLLAKAKAYDSDWFEALSGTSDLRRILTQVAEYRDAKGAPALTPEWTAICEDRLRFVAYGAGSRQQEYAVRAVLLARELGIDMSAWDDGTAMTSMLDAKTFFGAAEKLPARDLKPLLQMLFERDVDATENFLLDHLGDLSLALFSEGVDQLIGNGRETACAERMRAHFKAREVNAEMLLWVSQRLDVMQKWKLGSPAVLPGLALDALMTSRGGERLRAQNQLVQLTGEREWLKNALDAMTDLERRDFLTRIQRDKSQVVVDRSMITARVIRLHPELQSAGGSIELADGESKPQARFTSWRSLRGRQEELKRLVKVDIPKNSKEIALARSYGDLRENHEYKSAKEHQGLLMQRQGELEQALRDVKGTDFGGFSSDRVGLGTIVSIERPDGSSERYTILGEWDRDEALGIISSESLVAQRLSGSRVGDEVQLPGRNGDDACRILSVSELDDPVRSWVAG